MQVVDVETAEVRELLVDGGRVVRFEGTGPDDEVDVWVLPGLVDVHNHLSLFSPAGDDAEPPARVRASASLELAVGILAIREPGSPDGASRALNDEPGWPKMITMGRFLAPPGGYFPGLAREVPESALPVAAMDEARRSGGWAKIIGDFLDRDGRFRPNWSAAALGDAVGAVHGVGGRVAVHVLCSDAVDAAVAAGVDSIEHGWAIGEDHFGAMRAANTAWVPTLHPGGSHAACAFARSAGVAERDQRWIRQVLDRQPELIARAHAAGVTVLAGTDAGQVPHGRIVEQIELLARTGMPVRDAIGAASWTARRYLGLPCLEPGTAADFVVYRADPALDPDTLRRPATIVLDGEIVAERIGVAR